MVKLCSARNSYSFSVAYYFSVDDEGSPALRLSPKLAQLAHVSEEENFSNSGSLSLTCIRIF